MFYSFSAFEKIFINKLYLFTRIISQAFRKYIVLLGSCKHIKSYGNLAKRWFENITFLKFNFSAKELTWFFLT